MRSLAVIALAILTACGPGSFNVPEPGRSSTELPPGAVRPSEIPASASAPSTARPTGSAGTVTMKEFPVPSGSGPHDVAPAADGGVWFTAQRSGQLGWLDPKTGQTKMIPLGAGSAPHGVIVGPDGAPWITDGGLNAIVRVDPRTSEIKRFDMTIPRSVYGLPKSAPRVDLNTAVFDPTGTLWFTGQSGFFGRVQSDGRVDVFEAPRGPYGITATPTGDVFYASLAASHIAKVAKETGTAEQIPAPTRDQGARRVWSDSKGVIWVSEWNVGQLGRYDPATKQWKEWKLPGTRPQAYAVFVDDRDIVWLSEWSASAIVRFDPATEKFDVFPHAPGGSIRQLHGRPGEVWGALSSLDRLLLLTTR